MNLKKLIKQISNYFFILLIITNYFVISIYFDNKQNNLIINFLNIGQGDATLIQTPDNLRILIDGGPDSSILPELSKIMPFWERSIDLVILTHPDLDHLGGLIPVLQNYKIEKIFYTNVIHKSYFYDFFEEILVQNRIEVIVPEPDSNFKIGCCVFIDMLWPLDYKDINELEVNDTSLSFELIYKNFDIFFGGDISKKIEEKILENNIWLDVDILKINHHGSNTSTSEKFVKHITPELAIISAGKDNKFGHPKKEVLDTLVDNNVKIMRTDISGTIKIESNGENFF